MSVVVFGNEMTMMMMMMMMMMNQDFGCWGAHILLMGFLTNRNVSC